MSIQRVRIDLYRVLEVLGRTLAFAEIGKKVGEMNATSKVITVKSQTLLVVLHTLLEVFGLLVAHAQEVEGVGLWWTLRWIFSLYLDCSLE